MKRFTTSWMRVMLLGLVSLFAFQEAGAATVSYDGINYTTSGTKATVKRYTFTKGDTTFYKGDIVIPETFELKGVTYTVVATALTHSLTAASLLLCSSQKLALPSVVTASRAVLH